MHVAIFAAALAWSPLLPPIGPARLPRCAAATMQSAAPTLREQMKAYLKSVQERGVEVRARRRGKNNHAENAEETLLTRACASRVCSLSRPFCQLTPKSSE